MATARFPSRRSALALVGLIGLSLLWTAGGVQADLPGAFTKATPENLDDLRAIQSHVQKLLKKVIPCTVGVQINSSSGSGIIVSADGKVLTAGHVSGMSERRATIFLSDGRKLMAKTLGSNRGIDSGMLQILDSGPWPYLEMGMSADLKNGDWCLAVGHPGGYKKGRSPVVRLGRVLSHGEKLIRTDCTLVGGDSGGPLLDMDGRVIGIHSRIGNSLSFNIHVPVDTYRETWERLAKGETWGDAAPAQNAKNADAYMGVQLDAEAKICRIREVTSGSPAEKAGLRADDILLMFAGKKVGTVDDLSDVMRQQRPGNEVSLEVRRGTETITLRLVLGKRPS